MLLPELRMYAVDSGPEVEPTEVGCVPDDSAMLSPSTCTFFLPLLDTEVVVGTFVEGGRRNVFGWNAVSDRSRPRSPGVVWDDDIVSVY